MAKYATLKAAVEAAIKTNGAQQITGQVLQTQLVNMITSLGKYFQSFGGLATPAGSFSAGDESVTFLAVEAGTYTNFGGAVLDGKTLHILAYDGDWADVDTLIPSGAAFEAALALAIKGSQSGIAEGIADTISAGTAQEFLQRQSGGDGVNCLKRIKGKTRAWRQLFANKTTPTFAISEGASYPEVAAPTESYEIISGHKYLVLAKITLTSGTMPTTLYMTWRQTGDYQITPNVPRVLTALTDTTISANSGVLRVLSGRTPAAAGTCFAITADLTMFYGSEIDGMTDAQVLAKYMQEYGQFYYAPASVLKSNDAAALLTDGRNQWDEVWESGKINSTDGATAADATRIRSKNYIPIFGGLDYYIKNGGSGTIWVFTYDANKGYISYSSVNNAVFTPAANVAYIKICPDAAYGTTYNNDICINLSDPSFNGTYEPYWQRVLALRLSELTGIPEGGTEADRVTMFPNGVGGAGSAFDSLFVENGVTKARKTMTRIYIPDSAVSYSNSKFVLTPASLLQSSTNYIVSQYGNGGVHTVNAEETLPSNAFYVWGAYIWFPNNNGYADVAAFKAAMSGVYLEYELATPIVYTDLQYADGAPFTMPATILVDNYGTERIQAPEGATTPSAPFCCDSNYSIGVANLVKRLAALENAE